MKVATAAAALLAACPRPPVDPPSHDEPDLVGVTHVVRPGQTLWRIARAYRLEVGDLALVNGLRDPSQLPAGTALFIPGATAAVDVPADGPEPDAGPSPEGPTEVGSSRASRPVAPARLSWPVLGVLYARFGRRGSEFHDGIDFAAPEGTPVLAAGDGVVIFAGEQRGYGRIVLVSHDDGLVTLYAHNRDNRVHAGERVAAGQAIATVGQSGKTTGPHLHFEVREAGRPRDPLLYLPKPR